MKPIGFLLFTAAAAAFGANIGDTYQQVITEKGTPKSHLEVGILRILKYPDATIELKNDVVVSIKAVVAPPPADNPPSAPPGTATGAPPSAAPSGTPGAGAGPTSNLTPEQQFKAVQKVLKETIERVQRIVNQPVTMQPISTGMNVTMFNPGWFKEGTVKPDFDHVDVRTTQKLDYDRFEYVSSNLNPGMAFTASELEFNPMTKFFYTDLTVPKKRLSESEMLEINRLYRIIGRCEKMSAELKGGAKP